MSPAPPAPPTAHLHAADLRGLALLATEATARVSEIVETMHHDVLRPPWPGRGSAPRRTGGIAGLVYRSIRGVTRVAGGTVDGVFGLVTPHLPARRSTPQRDAWIAALNGVLGDHLAATANPLGLGMELRSLAGAPPAGADGRRPGGAPCPRRVVLLVHGLCLNELHWQRDGHHHGAALAADLGVEPLYVRYNSGLHISTNGRLLAERLEALCRAGEQPVTELAIVGHSMGGLVARSACHHAAGVGHRWLASLRTLVFLATPHHGAALERAGHGVDRLLGAAPWAAALARLGKARSAGITDLRFGNLLDADWAAHDRFAAPRDVRRPVPLPAGVACHAIAASRTPLPTRRRAGGDGLVSVASALGHHRDPARRLAIPPERQHVVGGTGHLAVLGSRDVYAHLRAAIAGEA